MDNRDALRILYSLADGVDPRTGEVFAADSPYQRTDVVRALYAAVRALEAAWPDRDPDAARDDAGADARGDGWKTVDGARARYPASEFRPLLITEVTRMLHGHFCIAGYDLHARRMARPLRPNAEPWVFNEFQPAFSPGQLVNIPPLSEHSGSSPPHGLEDLTLRGVMTVLETWTHPEMLSAMLPGACQTITQLFDCRPLENKYVVEGTDCRSLGGVRTTPGRLEFRPGAGNRVRLQLDDADGELYNLPVTCHRFRSVFDPGGGHGVEGANAWLASVPADAPIVLRVGLTRGYAGSDGEFSPRRCYVQVNGILCSHPLPEAAP